MGQDIGAKIAGVVFYLIFAALWAAGAFWLWPNGVTDIPLSSLTLGGLLRAAGAALMGLIAVICVFGAINDAND